MCNINYVYSNVLIRSARALSPEAYPAIRTMPSSWSRTELETDGYSWPMLQLTAFFCLFKNLSFSEGDAVDAIPTSCATAAAAELQKESTR